MEGPQSSTFLHHSYPPPPSTSMPPPPMPSFTSQTNGHTSPTGGQTQTQTQTQTDATDRARAYKSRNKRPCDFCRYKKAACHLESAPPCELCIRHNKECTFVESPAKRRRPNEQADKNGDTMFKLGSNGSIDHGPHFSNGGLPSLDIQHEFLPWENGINPFQMSGMPTMSSSSSMGPTFAFDPALYETEPINFETFEPMSASTTTNNTNDHKFPNHNHRHSASMDTASPQSQSAALPVSLHLPFDSTSGESSLDRQNSSNAQIIGISGESDPYLLSRYRYDEYNEASFQSVRMRKMNSGPVDNDSSIPTFFQIQHNALAAKAQPQDKSDTNEKWRRELTEFVDDETGRRLIQLFYKYVQPYFPVLSREGSERDAIGVREPREVSPCVLAAIYGHALPFCAWDEKLCVEVYTPPSADVLFKIAWLSCQPLLHTPNIAVLQTLLLLVQRRPTNRHVSDTPFKWVIMTTAVSIAQALGINRDPTDWPLPSWEIKQRKRLAWAVYIQDKWLALNFGRSSHINPDDWDVPALTDDDFPEADRKFDDGQRTDFSCTHFIKLCELTIIVNDILRDLFSIKATRQLHTSLESTLEVAKPLRIRLTEWYQALPAGLLPCQPGASAASVGSPDSTRRRSVQLELDGNGSLQLAYITAKIELFRAMLRPRVTDANAAAVTALRTGALAVAKEISEFLETLNARELEAFWASYARTNFTIASSFMLLLFITSPTLADAKECLQLLNAWRSLLRIKSRSCDLLNLALLRLDGVFVAGMDRLIELSPAAQQAWVESGQSK
ncbi:Communesin biosynthesis cluster-specific transcription factor cnsN [Pseudocercospora fuligena]|uniref:Communesin biosynthesis cluster-specific transcription factor cnsN n=1 Tax=Pseudocercospora fuligena TaxID=685502 RepID=A0A8H6RG12_9PEZI|nr:Communesin biosynthesis cluster-specific transcription factor cnsN [Pseudocercospora fuligena]